jgi:hypothetical protein
MEKQEWAAHIAHVRTRARHVMAVFIFAAWILSAVLFFAFVPPIDYAPGDIRGTTLWRVTTFVIILGVGLVGLSWAVRGLRADRATRASVISTTIQMEPQRIYHARREATIRQLADQMRIGEVAAEALVSAWEAEAATRGLDRDSLIFWEAGASWIVERYLR